MSGGCDTSSVRGPLGFRKAVRLVWSEWADAEVEGGDAGACEGGGGGRFLLRAICDSERGKVWPEVGRDVEGSGVVSGVVDLWLLPTERYVGDEGDWRDDLERLCG